jgi:hypothetical protein
MSDPTKKIAPESQEQERLETERERENQGVEISVGKETREAIEGTEIPSGEISEKTGQGKEGYTGVAGGKGVVTIKKDERIPEVKVMKKEVERSVRKEMKILQKRIRQVMEKPGSVEAYQLNGLIANLRKLQEILASLVYATGDFIKDLWFKYVKKEN